MLTLAAAVQPHMTWWQAVVQGVVEGLTEYLPVSSTGHLILTQSIAGVPDNDATEAYAIVIQVGAIAAVLGLYFGRVRQMGRGLLGRDAQGWRLLVNIMAAFIPAAVIGLLFQKQIHQYLMKPWPIVAAWLVGGLIILVLDWSRSVRGSRGGRDVDHLDWSRALIIGWIQCLGMWPGTSRSLVTILGGIAVGMSLGAAVEFSFLLGLVTLSAAAAYEGYKYRHALLSADVGLVNIIIGLLVSAVFAAISVKWMVTYLRRHGLCVFGWYRVALAVVVGALLLGDVIHLETGPKPAPRAATGQNAGTRVPAGP
jgi:undecaprenyl-diphosphatase